MGHYRVVNFDPHATLGVAPDAEPEVVDAAYRALMKKYHPDRYSSDDAERRTQALNEAYAELRPRAAPPPIEDSAGAPPDPFFTDPIDPNLIRPPFRAGRRYLQATAISAALLAAIVVLVRATG